MVTCLTAVDSLEARVISRLPLRPSRAGTRMKTSVTSLNTDQCCKDATAQWEHIRIADNTIWISISISSRTTFNIDSQQNYGPLTGQEETETFCWRTDDHHLWICPLSPTIMLQFCIWSRSCAALLAQWNLVESQTLPSTVHVQHEL